MSNNENANNNNEPEVKKLAFNKTQPLELEAKEEILGMIIHAMKNFVDADEACRKDITSDMPDSIIKRTVALSTAVAYSAVKILEKSGAAIVLDEEKAIGILTPYVIPGPALVFGIDKVIG